jgi:tetratricopeptide (TPR) repeat protein
MFNLRRFAIGGVVILLGVVYVMRQPDKTPPNQAVRATRAVAPPVRGTLGMLTTHERTGDDGMVEDPTAPSATNVSHRYRQRVAGLKARLDAAPADTSALSELAGLYFDAHSMESAAEHYEAYLALRPQARQHWLDLATAHASLGNWEAASEATAGLLAEYPGDAAGLYNMGVIAANQADTEAAADWLHRAMETEDSDIADKARAALARLTGTN